MANTYELSGRTALVARPAKIAGVPTEIVDVTQADEIELALSRLDDQSRIDILVNNAGYLGQIVPFADQPRDEWRRILDTNLVGTIQVTQAVLPRMIRAGAGRIVNLGSLAGKEGLAGLAAYSASSGGVIALTKALSREVIGHGIFVNCIAPGPIDTDMIRGLGEESVAGMIADSPMRRLGTAEEVAHLVAWLCTEASRFNTGAVFDMSGGRARY